MKSLTRLFIFSLLVVSFAASAMAQPGTKLTCGPRALEIEVAATPFYKDGTCRAKVA